MKFNGFEVQDQLTTLETFSSEEACGGYAGSDLCGGKLVSQIAECFDGNFTGDLTLESGFLLFGVMP